MNSERVPTLFPTALQCVCLIAGPAKSAKCFFSRWCGRGDSNPYALASASPSSWPAQRTPVNRISHLADRSRFASFSRWPRFSLSFFLRVGKSPDTFPDTLTGRSSPGNHHQIRDRHRIGQTFVCGHLMHRPQMRVLLRRRDVAMAHHFLPDRLGLPPARPARRRRMAEGMELSRRRSRAGTTDRIGRRVLRPPRIVFTGCWRYSTT